MDSTHLIHGYSPFKQLSNELINEIFLFSFVSEHPYSQFHSVRLSHVCAHWREIAISNWRLWNEITLPQWTSERKMENTFLWTKEIIRRTQDAPVHLSIGFNDWHESWERVVTSLFMQLEARVRKIELIADYLLLSCSHRSMQSFAAISQTKAPLLVAMCIAILGENPGGLDFPVGPIGEYIAPTNTFQRLQSITYEGMMIINNLLPSPSLAYITQFTAKINFATTKQLSQWLETLRCMPNLEHLFIVFYKPVLRSFTVESSDYPKIYFSHLKDLYLSASCRECAELGRYLKLPPGCAFGMEYTNRFYRNESEEVICQEIIPRWSEETCVDVFDKHLELNIHPDFLRIALYSQATPDHPILMLKFIYERPQYDAASWVREANDLEDDTDKYLSLVNSIRMMHTLHLTDAIEVYLKVEQHSLLESFSAPVLGPFVRACTAQKLHLTGTKFMFMLPILKSFIMGSGERELDLALFANNASWNFRQYLEDVITATNPETMPQSLKLCLTPTPDEEKKYRARERSLEKQKTKTVHFLHADFDMTTLEGHTRLFDVLFWIGKWSKVLKEFRAESRVETYSTCFVDDECIDHPGPDALLMKVSSMFYDINFERDFGQWFNPPDVQPLPLV